MLAQIDQRGGRCPIPGNRQGHVGRGSEQADLIEDVPAHCRGVGLDGLERSLPTRIILLFCESMIIFGSPHEASSCPTGWAMLPCPRASTKCL